MVSSPIWSWIVRGVRTWRGNMITVLMLMESFYIFKYYVTSVVPEGSQEPDQSGELQQVQLQPHPDHLRVLGVDPLSQVHHAEKVQLISLRRRTLPTFQCGAVTSQPPQLEVCMTTSWGLDSVSCVDNDKSSSQQFWEQTKSLQFISKAGAFFPVFQIRPQTYMVELIYPISYNSPPCSLNGRSLVQS